MTFNIEYGGTVVDLDKILAAVRRADADVVAFNEAYGKVAQARAAHRLRLREPPARPRLALPDRRRARLGRALRLRAARARQRGRGRQRAPEPRATTGRDGCSTGGAGARCSAPSARLRVPDLRPFLRATEELAGRRHPHVRRGRLQLALARGLDRGHGGPPAADPLPGRVAGDRAARAQGVRRFVARRAPRPRRRRGAHVARGTSAVRHELEPPPRRPPRPHRPDLVGGPAPRRSRASSSGNAEGPASTISVRPWGSDHRAVVSTFDVTAGDAAGHGRRRPRCSSRSASRST